MIAPKPHFQPKSKRLPERVPVTVCIGAIAKHDNQDVLVCVSDTKLSAGGLYSQDMAAWKMRRLHQYWFAMIAGQYSQHRAICEAISAELDNIEEPTLAIVTKAATDVYIRETRRFAEESILAKYGLSMPEFLNSRKQIGDSLFERTWVEISQIQVECELLIVGFDTQFDRRTAHLFTVSNPTSGKPVFVTEHDSPSFAAIGSGAYAAESILYSFRHISVHDLYKTIYQTCVAKYFAETASDVGKITALNVINSSGSQIETAANLANHLSQLWRKNRTLEIPEEGLAFIENSIKQLAVQTSAGQQ